MFNRKITIIGAGSVGAATAFTLALNGLATIQQRDFQDTHRQVAPLKMCRDSIKLDTSDMDIEQVLQEMKNIIAKKVAP